MNSLTTSELRYEGKQLCSQYKYNEAVIVFKRMAKNAINEKNNYALMEAFHELSWVTWLQKNYIASEKYLNHTIHLANLHIIQDKDKSTCLFLKALSIEMLGDIRSIQHNYVQAKRLYEKSLSGMTETFAIEQEYFCENPWSYLLLEKISRMDKALGNNDRSQRTLRDSVKMAVRLGREAALKDKKNAALMHYYYAWKITQNLGDSNLSSEYAMEILQLFENEDLKNFDNDVQRKITKVYTSITF